MTVEKRFSISLDVKQPTSNRDIEVVEGDTGNILVVTLTDNGQAVNLTDCKVCAVFAKPNGSTAMQDTDGNGLTVAGEDMNEITITLYNTSFSPGMVTCEIQVFSGEDMGTLITSAQFNFKCRRGIANEDTIQSTDEWPMLVEMMQRVDAAEAELIVLNEQTTEAAALADAATERANAAAENADRVSAEAAAEAKAIAEAAADQATATANSAAENAVNTAQEAADRAVSIATAAAEAAETITANAESEEASRQAAETQRVAAEAAREAAEAQRVSSEAERAAAETARQANEGTRQTQEQSRQTSTAAAIDAAEAATERANEAAERAEQAADGIFPLHNTTHAVSGNDPLTPDMIGAANKTRSTAITLPADGWEGEGPFTQTVAVEGLTGDRFENPDVFAEFTEAIADEQAAWSLVDNAVSVGGGLRFTCLSEKPEIDIPLIVKVRN